MCVWYRSSCVSAARHGQEERSAMWLMEPVHPHRCVSSSWNTLYQFDVFSTVHHSIGLFLQPTLMHNSITTRMSHYYPRHVSGLDMPILRRNNCTNTESGILALLSGCTLHRLRADCRLLSTGVVYSEDTRCCVCAVVPPEDGHVKARNMSRIVMWHTCCYWIVH